MAFIDYTKYPLPRSRHHVGANLYVPKRDLKIEPTYYPPLYNELHWTEFFASGAPPSVLDIGCGLGKFMLETALATPAYNVLGLEVRKYAVDWIQNVIAGERVANASVLWYNVANGLPFIPSASVQQIFYFFPDPWFKRRHHGRRAFTPAFLDECARILAPEGTMYLMTDVPEVDTYQRATMHKHGKFRYESVENEAEWGLQAKTNHQEFCERKGIPYTRLKCQVLK
jgi:tRNA (guanine-N7-)-methyltransferase